MRREKGPVPGGAELRRARLAQRDPETIKLSRTQVRAARKRTADAAAARFLAEYDASATKSDPPAGLEAVPHDCEIDGHIYLDDEGGFLSCAACPTLWVETRATGMGVGELSDALDALDNGNDHPRELADGLIADLNPEGGDSDERTRSNANTTGASKGDNAADNDAAQV